MESILCKLNSPSVCSRQTKVAEHHKEKKRFVPEGRHRPAAVAVKREVLSRYVVLSVLAPTLLGSKPTQGLTVCAQYKGRLDGVVSAFC